jgi:hypothetical protein
LRRKRDGRETELILFESARKRKRERREADVILFETEERCKRDGVNTM